MSRLFRNRWVRLFASAIRSHIADGAPLLSSALAYQAIFTLVPLLVTIVAVAGIFLGNETTLTRVHELTARFTGLDIAFQVSAAVRAYGSVSGSRGVTTVVVSSLLAAYGSIAAFGTLQQALVRILGSPKPRPGVLGALGGFLVTAFMVLVAAALLVAALLVSAGLAYFGRTASLASLPITRVAYWLTSFFLLALVWVMLFVAYARLTRRHVAAGDAAFGAAVAAVLLAALWSVIRIFIAEVGGRSLLGNAGAVAGALIWASVSAQAVLFGAEAVKARCELREQAKDAQRRSARQPGDELRADLEGSPPSITR